MNTPFKTRIFKTRLINKIKNFTLVQYDRSLILVQNAVQNILHTVCWPAEKLKTNTGNIHYPDIFFNPKTQNSATCNSKYR